MGLFKKKADPITERARALNEQIADLESQIAQLANKLESEPPPAPPSEKAGPSACRAEASERRPVPPEPPPSPAGQPRLRSTAFPQKQVVVHSGADEPVFEEVPNNPFKVNGEEPPPEPEPDIGVRKGTFGEMWRRVQNHFRGPPASNPKLVSYLAAGSIQGLRPLRYEKRVARNRTIALMIILILVIWGLLAVFLRK